MTKRAGMPFARASDMKSEWKSVQLPALMSQARSVSPLPHPGMVLSYFIVATGSRRSRGPGRSAPFFRR